MREKPGSKMLFGFLILLALTAQVEARKVQVAVATFSQSILPLVVAQERGYYREEDLDVVLILMTASVANLALIGGNVDFISSGSSAVGAMLRRSRGEALESRTLAPRKILSSLRSTLSSSQFQRIS